jgi:hypothetical protein
MEKDKLYAGTLKAIVYELFHALDEVIHAIPFLEEREWALRFCNWAHRYDWDDEVP